MKKIILSLLIVVILNQELQFWCKYNYIISGYNLIFYGLRPIKGFSITLGIGIFTTLFSVYFIARLFTAIYVSKNKDKEALI